VSDDWRVTNQEKYLTGVTLTRKAWRQTRQGCDHDHCEFCSAKFGGPDLQDALREGWTTDDEYRWICDPCFGDFRERFDWRTRTDT